MRADDPAAVRICMHSSALGQCVPGSAVAVERTTTEVRQLVDSTEDLGDLQLVLGVVPAESTESAVGATFTDVALSPLQQRPKLKIDIGRWLLQKMRLHTLPKHLPTGLFGGDEIPVR